MAGVLDGSPLRAKIHVGEAETLGIAFDPLEIVHEAPVMISADVGAVEHGAPKRVKIATHELNPAFVGDAAVLIGGIKIGAAVLGDFEGRTFGLAGDSEDAIV